MEQESKSYFSEIAVSEEESESVHVTTQIPRRPYLDDISNHLKIALIGTTNVGKSSLFNAMCKSKKAYSLPDNALFTTIDPVIATFVPYDERLIYFQQCYRTAVLKPAQITIVDTPGLVYGSIREKAGVGFDPEILRHMDVIVVVLKCFDSTHLAQYINTFDPLKDVVMIGQELLQMDLIRIEKFLSDIEEFLEEVETAEYLLFQYELLKKLWAFIAGEDRPPPPKRSKSSRSNASRNAHRTRLPRNCTGLPIRLGHWDLKEREAICKYKLLSAKELVYLANITAIDYNRQRSVPCIEDIRQYLHSRQDNSEVIAISAELEQRLLDVETEGIRSQHEGLHSHHHSAVPRILESIYNTINICHFYMITPELIRCYILRRGNTVTDAAARTDIHIARNLIKAEVISFDDFLAYKADYLKLEMDGKIHSEGRRYVVNDGDILRYVYHAAVGNHNNLTADDS